MGEQKIFSLKFGYSLARLVQLNETNRMVPLLDYLERKVILLSLPKAAPSPDLRIDFYT